MKYTATVGINYIGSNDREIRVEPGGNVPASVVKRSPWLVDQGLVTKVDEADEAEDSADV